MKKIILVAASIAVSVSAFAQMSVSAGYLNNASKQEVKLSESTTQKDSWNSNGAYLQGTYILPLGLGLDLNAGVRFAWLTNTSTGNFDLAGVHLADATAVNNEFYLQVPVTASYTYRFNRDLSLYAFAGPSLSFGLASHTDYTYKVLGAEKKETVNNYAKDDEGNRSYNIFNLYLGGGLGVEFRDMLRLSVSYDFGLLNRSAVENVKLTENLLSVGVSFLF